MQLALSSIQKAGKEKSALLRFLRDATRQVPDLKEALQSMAISRHFVAETFKLSDFDDSQLMD